MTAGLQACATLARDNYPYYCSLAMRYRGDKCDWHSIHSLVCEVIQQCEAAGRKCVLVMPPGTGKTTLVQSYVPWRLGRDPRLSVEFVSYSEDRATDNLMVVRKMLMSDLSKWMWPEVSPSAGGREGGTWNKKKLYLAEQMRTAAEAHSVLSDAQGRRCDLIIFDDCITQTCLEEAPTLEKVHGRIHGTWLYRLPPGGGFAIFLNNCWHRSDSIHDFKLRAEEHNATVLWVGYDWECTSMHWEVINPPESWLTAGVETSGQWGLWGSQPRKVLLERRANAPTFKRLYMQLATVDSDSWLVHPTKWKEYAPDQLPKVADGAKAIAYLDVSGGRSVKHGDYAAAVWGLKGPDGTLYVLDVFCQRCDPREQIRALWIAHKTAVKYGFHGLHRAEIEIMAKDEGWVAIPEWMEEFKQVEPHVVRLPWAWDYADRLANKEARISALFAPLSTGDIKFPAGFYEQTRGGIAGESKWSTERRTSWELFLNQCEDFGSKQSEHDDSPDALSGLWRLCEKTYAGQKKVPSTEQGALNEQWQQIRRFREDDRQTGNSKPPERRGIDGLPEKRVNAGGAWRL